MPANALVQARIDTAVKERAAVVLERGKDTCVYERIIAGTNSLMRIPVLFDHPNYEQGHLLGRATSVFMLDAGRWDSGQVGEIFWVASEEQKDEK